MPGADMPLITLNQARMVLQIAAVYGNDLSADRIREVAAVVAGGFGCRALARKLVSLAPVMGLGDQARRRRVGHGRDGVLRHRYYEGRRRARLAQRGPSTACSTCSPTLQTTARPP